MRDHYMSSYYLLILLLSVTIVPPPAASARIQDLVGGASGTPRRILHQPLFPVSSEPPPTPELPPPPPPSPITPEFPDPDQPFFPEVPNGQTTGGGQVQQPPPAASTTAEQHSNPLATQPTKPAKRVAVAVSVAIVTLGMLSALAFYIYKHRAKHSGETRKLVEGDSERPRDESSVPPVQSNFLYLGTVDPVSHTEKNGSPYRKLSSMKRSDRNKPSPDLHPLPPLAKPPLPTMGSPPPMSSSDDEEEEGHERAFFTPQGSSVSYEGSFKSSSSRHRSSNSSLSHGRARGQASTSTSIPHSKRTSPRSRLSFSSPDKAQPDKCVPAPPLPPSSQPMPRVQYSQPTFSYYSPKRPKFSAPPPPPNMERLQAITNTAPPPPPSPPPPPPPLPPLPTTKKLGELGTNFSSMPSQELRRSELRVSNSKPRSFEEVNEGNLSFSERADAEDDADESKPRLKPLHWDKVRATSDRATVWDQLKSSSFQLNEDMMETLFGCNSTSSVPKEATKRSVLPTVEREDRVLDPKKSQNIAILLRALNVTRDEVSDALLDGNPEGLGAELLETLVKMAPTKEEEIKLRDYKGDVTKLGSAERFLKTILDIPFAFKRVEAMLYRANFDTEVKYLRKAFQTLEIASEELKNSRLFLKLLEAVLRTGNRMNVGTNRGEAKAFKLETLLKLVDIKGTDGKTTLLHFVVQEIIKSEGAGSDPNHTNKLNSNAREEDFKKQGLNVVSGLSRELENVKKAAGMDSDVLSSYVSKLEMGLEKVRAVLQYEKPDMPGKFFESMKMFLKEAEDEITRIKAHERKALSVVKEVTEYFHGNTPKELAHPFRIFMIVREFLSILDNVCKEVRRMQDSTVGSSRSFRIAPNASLPVLNRYHTRQDSSSDEDSTSP